MSRAVSAGHGAAGLPSQPHETTPHFWLGVLRALVLEVAL